MMQPEIRDDLRKQISKVLAVCMAQCDPDFPIPTTMNEYTRQPDLANQRILNNPRAHACFINALSLVIQESEVAIDASLNIQNQGGN